MSTDNGQRQLEAELKRLVVQNQKLVELLRRARRAVAENSDSAAHQAGDQPAHDGLPASFAMVISEVLPGTRQVEVFTSNRRLRVAIGQQVDLADVRPGVWARVGENSGIEEICGTLEVGEIYYVDEVMDHLVVVSDRAGNQHVVARGYNLDEGELLAIQPGDTVIADTKAGVVYGLVATDEARPHYLTEIPEVSFADIGGLDEAIETLRDAVELPVAYPELCARFELQPPKGMLLYGPPGCGKTMLAKAVAHSLVAATESNDTPRGYFLSVKGPELLNKYVGETERMIRVLFHSARQLARSGSPVVVFFDEMEALFRSRGSGVSSDMETTIVPQILAELDGMEDADRIVIIGATNREELIDPALTRPGRLDLKIKIPRPDRVQAAEILRRHLRPAHSLAADVEKLITAGVEAFFRPVDLLVATTSSGEIHRRPRSAMLSGAMIAHAVQRAKKMAIKDIVAHQADPATAGVTMDYLLAAIEEEYAASAAVIDTANVEQCARLFEIPGVVRSIELVGLTRGLH